MILRNWYSIFESICSAELFGTKVLIPCSFLNVIQEDYGKNWKLPIKSGYGWSSIRFNEWKVFDKSKWPNSKKSYNNFGKINVNGTLKALNDHIGVDGIIKTIHSDLIDDI